MSNKEELLDYLIHEYGLRSEIIYKRWQIEPQKNLMFTKEIDGKEFLLVHEDTGRYLDEMLIEEEAKYCEPWYIYDITKDKKEDFIQSLRDLKDVVKVEVLPSAIHVTTDWNSVFVIQGRTLSTTSKIFTDDQMEIAWRLLLLAANREDLDND